MRRTATFAVGLVLGVVLWGTAMAAIPDSSGVIHGCRKTSPPSQVGQLRVIDTEAGQACTSNEVALTWNQEGPQGATGPQGPQGATGPAGPENIAVVHRGCFSSSCIGNSEFVTNGGYAFGYKFCEEGEVATGGGYSVLQVVQADAINSRPVPPEVSDQHGGLDGWEVGIVSDSVGVPVFVHVVCTAGTFTRES